MVTEANTEETLDETQQDEVLDAPSEEETASEAGSEEESKISKEEADKKAEAKFTDADLTAKYEEWQAAKDKELKVVYVQIDELKQSNADLKRQLEDKEDDRDLKAMFEADEEQGDEATAKKRDEARRKFTARWHEYKEKAEEVEKQVEDNHQRAEKLGGIEKVQQARIEALKLVMPKDTGLISQVEAIVQKLSEAETPREFDLILNGIKQDFASKTKKFVPDSGKQSGSVGDLTLKGEDAVTAGLRKLKK